MPSSRPSEQALLDLVKKSANAPSWIGKKTTSTFDEADIQALHDIIEECHQLYLDEIAAELTNRVGKVWDDSTICRKLHSLGYRLKLVVFRARQASEARDDLISLPSCLLVLLLSSVDEDNKSKGDNNKVG